jgi:hypothetical protein
MNPLASGAVAICAVARFVRGRGIKNGHIGEAMP